MILVTGGAGFIGANFVLDWLAERDELLVNLDLLTYSGNLANLKSIADDTRHIFIRGDIADKTLIADLLDRYQPRAVLHFAAESHVDRSIHGPEVFVQTNVLGTFQLLESVRAWYQSLDGQRQTEFRFLHVSTDEVYGSLKPDEPGFVETTAYAPNSPYSASKAASDHLVRAYHHTFGLPTLTTNCSNNYGQFQFPEKLIPLLITNALARKPLPIYGDGLNIRDWLYVKDHCSAVRLVLEKGSPGESYNIGGLNEMTNLDLVRIVCSILDELAPHLAGPYAHLISFVQDRPGHDRRYAINADKIQAELGWKPAETFATGIRKTVAWYLENPDWMESVISGEYRDWIKTNYQERKDLANNEP